MDRKGIQLEIDRAAELMEENAKEEAKAILEKLLSEYPSREQIYQASIDIFWWGKMFSEIKELHKRYREKTGNELKANVSVNDIERKLEILKKNRPYDASLKKVFRRISWWLYFIKEIEVSEQGISFKMITSKSYFYNWPEVKQVVLRKIEGSEQISVLAGPSARSLVIQTTDGRRYKVNIGQDEQSQSLLCEIRDYVRIERGPTKKEHTLIAIVVAIIIFLVMGIGYRAGWDGAKIGWICLLIVGLYYFFHKRL